MAKETTTRAAQVLERIERLLSLGEAIRNLHCATDDNPFMKERASATAEDLRKRIDTMTTALQSLIPTDKAIRPLRVALRQRTKQPPPEAIWIIALVAYNNMTATHHHESVDEVANVASDIFAPDPDVLALKGLLKARQTIGGLIEDGALKLKGDHLFLSAALRHWLACDNEYAVFGLSEEELKVRHHRVARTNQERAKKKSFQRKIEAIPALSPQELFDEVGNRGFIGQEDARRTVCLGAYRHINRLRLMHLDGVEADQIPARQNILLMGETGTGKSLLTKILFEDILQLPTSMTDATTITECGYVGEDANIVLSKLMHAANGEQVLAEQGVAVVDEFDKLAASGTNFAAFNGAGTRNDVSKSGVQRGLLKIFEGSMVDMPLGGGPMTNKSQRIRFNTENVLFICSGSFTGIEELSKSRAALGFGGNAEVGNNENEIDALCNYGMHREIVGRFGAIARLTPLTVDDLSSIVKQNTITRFVHELSLQGIELCIAPEVTQFIVERALDRGTGARGLNAELDALLNDACFDAYSSSREVNKVRLFKEDQSVMWDITYKRGRTRSSS